MPLLIDDGEEEEDLLQQSNMHRDWFSSKGSFDAMSTNRFTSGGAFHQSLNRPKVSDTVDFEKPSRIQPARKRQKPLRFQSQPTNPQKSGAKVVRYRFDISTFQCIVELPTDAKPGDRYLVKWPSSTWLKRSDFFVVECPRSLEGSTDIPRRITVMAPNTSFNNLQEKRCALLPSAGERRSNIGRSRARIGKKYQVDKLPSVRQCQPAFVADPFEPRSEQLWDAQRAFKSSQTEGDIEGFLGEESDLNSKILRMEALHQANYVVDSARKCLQELLQKGTDVPIALNQEEAHRANVNSAFLKKDFGKVATDIGRSVSACMVHYYNWKKSVDYQRLKQKLCTVCNVGGEVMICFQCRAAYHLSCVVPSVQDGPADVWLCEQCLLSPAAKLRKRSLSNLDSSSDLPIKLLQAAVSPSPSKVDHRLFGVPQLLSTTDPPLSVDGNTADAKIENGTEFSLSSSKEDSRANLVTSAEKLTSPSTVVGQNPLEAPKQTQMPLINETLPDQRRPSVCYPSCWCQYRPPDAIADRFVAPPQYYYPPTGFVPWVDGRDSFGHNSYPPYAHYTSHLPPFSYAPVAGYVARQKNQWHSSPVADNIHQARVQQPPKSQATNAVSTPTDEGKTDKKTQSMEAPPRASNSTPKAFENKVPTLGAENIDFCI